MLALRSANADGSRPSIKPHDSRPVANLPPKKNGGHCGEDHCRNNDCLSHVQTLSLGTPKIAMRRRQSSSLPNGNSSCTGSGSGLDLRLTSCFIGQPLALRATYRDGLALGVVDADLGAGIQAGIELREIAAKVK